MTDCSSGAVLTFERHWMICVPVKRRVGEVNLTCTSANRGVETSVQIESKYKGERRDMQSAETKMQRVRYL